MELIMTIGTIILVVIGLIDFFVKRLNKRKLRERQIQQKINNSKQSDITTNKQIDLLNRELRNDCIEVFVSNEKVLEADKIIEELNRHNTEMLLIRYREKFNPSFYLNRDSILINLFSYLDNNKKLLVLIGKAGTGKSVFICDLITRKLENQFFWLQDCAQLFISEDQSIDSYIGNTLGYKIGIIELFELVYYKYPSYKLCLIFDAVNEYRENEKLIQRISEFVNKIQNTNLKVILTCRIPIWNTIQRNLKIPINDVYHTGGPNSYLNIDIYKEKEIREVFEKYKTVYNIKTPFDSLTDQVKEFIKQPLFLKLTADTYEGQYIPNTLALQNIFSKYIEKCLGPDGYESAESSILFRAVKLMYENAVRELPVTILKNDIEVNKYFVQLSHTPYNHLIDEGLLSQKDITLSLIKKFEVVFVTYEMVFEFLLAELFVNTLDEGVIINQLEIAQSKMFSQLRGAITFALSFSIINEYSELNLICKIANANHSGSRQFLIDVIHTIYQSGKIRLVYDIIDLLKNQKETEPQILAIEASYQLRLDNKLISFTLLNDEFLRDTASFYIYSRWNSERLNGKTEEGYLIINKLVSCINLTKPQSSYNAILAFLSVSLNMGIHIIDDPDSLRPLLEISRNLVKKVPGLSPIRSNNGMINFISEKTSEIIINTISKYLNKLMVDPSIYANIFIDNNAKRALLDVGSLINLDELTLYRDKVVRLISWNDPAVLFSSRSVLTCQVFRNPKIHINFLQEVFDNVDLRMQVKANILHAMIYGLIARLLNKKDINEIDLESIYSNYFDLINGLLINDNSEIEIVHFTENERKLYIISLQYLLFGILYIEAYLQRLDGIIEGSRFLNNYNFNSIISKEITSNIIIWCVEKIGYQGFVEFSFLTLTNKELLSNWLEISKTQGYTALANLRSVYQGQFDSFFIAKSELKELYEQVKITGSNLNPKDLWDVSYSIWIMVGTAVDTSIMKISGLALLDLVKSSGTDDFIKRIIRTILTILKDPEIIDIAHIQYGLAHDPKWNLFERLNIDENLIKAKPELNAFYKDISNEIVNTYGRGILYNEQ